MPWWQGRMGSQYSAACSVQVLIWAGARDVANKTHSDVRREACRRSCGDAQHKHSAVILLYNARANTIFVAVASGRISCDDAHHGGRVIRAMGQEFG